MLKKAMNFEEFEEAAQTGNLVPVYETLLADMLTPVSALLRLQAVSKKVFLLESVEGGERSARFSFLGLEPVADFEFTDGVLVIDENGSKSETETDLFEFLEKRFSGYKQAEVVGLPRLTGGVVGYFSYDTIRYFERVPVPGKAHETPEAMLMEFDSVLAFDHLKHQIFIIKNVPVKINDDLNNLYNCAREKLGSIRKVLTETTRQLDDKTAGPPNFQTSFEQSRFEKAVEIAKKYIAAGDIFQVVLSQKFETEVNATALDIYRALRAINPAPYLYFIQRDNLAIIGSSPEMLVRVEERELEVRPIAGTRPRGATPYQDARLAQQLLADKKEIAEHVMLVDLGRNDLGRVSEYGSIEVKEFMKVEKYSHVMHIVSSVRGKLKGGLSALDALKACFPAGTVSGAPKVRAMEIIAELETTHRGVYSGAVGYLDFSGNLDTCIAIRTLVKVGNKVYFQAGAGIVADSQPEREYEETLHKSAALRAAIEFAEGGLK